MQDEQIKHMVDRFLAWKLPAKFRPDNGISFNRVVNGGTEHQYYREPMGTNLLDAIQAAEMVRFMVEGLPTPMQDDLAGLIAYLRWYAKHVAPASVNAPHSKFLEAATTIEALTSEIAELQAERGTWQAGYIEEKIASFRAERDSALAEVAECHKNISLKADFIDATLNDCASKDQTIDELRTQLTTTQARLDEAVGLVNQIPDWTSRHGGSADALRAYQAFLANQIGEK